MTSTDLLERLRAAGSWAARHDRLVAGIAAGVWFVLGLPVAASFGGVAGLLAHLLLAGTIVVARLQPFLGLVLGAVGTLGLLGSGFVYGSGGTWWVFLPLLVVFFSTGASPSIPTRVVGALGIPFPAAFIALSVGYSSLPAGVVFVFFLLALFGLAWSAGLVVHLNRDRRIAESGAERATAALGVAKQEVTLEQERNRVAREVHDIVAHSLAVVIAQADGARYSAKDVPAPVAEALENIAATARGALTDVRVLLGELRHNQEAGPQPGMDDLDQLVRGFRESGLEIDWQGYGEAHPLTDAPALAVYRIVQEALTNALRHGDRAQPVELIFDWASSSLTVTVTNAIPRGVGVPVAGSGHGIPGMRERATLAGGELEASDGTNGRFRVRATIPFAARPVAA